jgi:hypothetical protein
VSDARGRGWAVGGFTITREYATRFARSGPCRGRAGPVNRAVPGLTLRAQLVAQARHYIRAVPGTGTKRNVSCRASAVLFSAVPGPAHRVSAIWPTILVAPRTALNLRRSRTTTTLACPAEAAAYEEGDTHADADADKRTRTAYRVGTRQSAGDQRSQVPSPNRVPWTVVAIDRPIPYPSSGTEHRTRPWTRRTDDPVARVPTHPVHHRRSPPR